MSVDPKTLNVYQTNVGAYAKKFDVSVKPGAHLVRFIAAMPPGGKVLDLGCGPGGSAAHMMGAGLSVKAVDASSEMVRYARDRHGVAARVGTFDDLTDEDAFHGVWANFSLLHAPRDDLPRHLETIAKSLKPSGHFHIGMKVGTGEARDQMDRFYTFVEEEELGWLLAGAGFTVLETDTGSDTGLAGTDDPWIVCFARGRDA